MNPYIKGKRKSIYAKGQRKKLEPYSPVASSYTGGVAWLEVDGKYERLIYENEHGKRAYVSEHVYILDLIFVDGWLIWIEKSLKTNDWSLKAIKEINAGGKADVIKTQGRPAMLAAWEGASGFLTWEERQGVTTVVKAMETSADAMGEIMTVTDNSHNAYDPKCALVDDILYCIYTSFMDGNYRICMKKQDRTTGNWSEEIIVSDDMGPCLYPSIYPRSEGGVWISYTATTPNPKDCYYTSNPTRRSQGDLYYGEGSQLRAGIYDGEQFCGVLAPRNPGANQGRVAAWIVFGTEYAAHSEIFEDAAGRAHILVRKSCDLESTLEVMSYEQEEDIDSGAEKGVKGAELNYPDLCLVTLDDKRWLEPVRLIKRAHLQERISYYLKDSCIHLAFTEDGRRTGHSGIGEWFDGDSEVAVGKAVIELMTGDKPDYKLEDFFVRPIHGNTMEDGIVEKDTINIEGEIYQRIMGQTHTHSTISVCSRVSDRHPHINYRQMQDAQHCKFGAVTDHAYNMWDTERLITNKLADYYYFPGSFVAYPAYEWTGSQVKFCSHHGGPFGHINPQYLEEEGVMEFYTPADPEDEGCSTNLMKEAYKPKSVIGIPHHVADSAHPFNWDYFDESFIPVIELYQDGRGSGEQSNVIGVTNEWKTAKKDQWAVEQLKKGKKFGFIAGADHRNTALAGVYVNEITRTGLYEGFMAKRCFASTGITANIDFSCNGRPMGGTAFGDKAAFTLNALTANHIKEVQIVKNGALYERVEIEGSEAALRWETGKEEGIEFWYCRLLLKNGEILWTSPIWLEV